MASIEEPGFRGNATGEAPVRQLLEYTTVRLRELEKTRRLLLGTTAVLVLLAATIAVFAPEGRERVGYAISAVLVVLAMGAVGAAQFKFKMPGVDLEAAQNRLRDDRDSSRRPRKAGSS